MLGMYGLSSIYFGYHDIRDIRGDQSEKRGVQWRTVACNGVQSEKDSHCRPYLQEITLVFAISTLDLDLGCTE